MGMIVEVDAQQQDEAAMLRALEELAARYPQSLSYASALFSVGNFFAGQEDWETAALYYKPLADNFPQDGRAADAHWRVAWAYYLQRENVSARQGFIDHLHNYPSSPHGPAALYWLGRLEEQSGDGLEARAPMICWRNDLRNRTTLFWPIGAWLRSPRSLRWSMESRLPA
jgi:TolA-binding protein